MTKNMNYIITFRRCVLDQALVDVHIGTLNLKKLFSFKFEMSASIPNLSNIIVTNIDVLNQSVNSKSMIKCKQKSMINIQEQADIENESTPSRISSVKPPNVHIDSVRKTDNEN